MGINQLIAGLPQNSDDSVPGSGCIGGGGAGLLLAGVGRQCAELWEGSKCAKGI